MISTRTTLAAWLLADPLITARIATYRGVPAVFARTPIPPSASGRYIYVGGPITDVAGAFDTKTTVGREVMHDIGFYEPESGDPSDLEDLARYVQAQLDRNPIAVSGFGVSLITKTFGPIEAPTDDQVYGRIITVSLDIATT